MFVLWDGVGVWNQGIVNTQVVLQEFLTGVEFVVDTLTWDGVHKTTAVWQYDKRNVNGGSTSDI